MRYLLDTNVISETQRPRPNQRVLDWLAQVDNERLYLSVVTLAEIRVGIELLPHGARRERLRTWVEEELPSRFEGRLLDVSADVAHAWGRIVARTQRAGSAMEAVDGLLAATAETHQLTLVTRNVNDFEQLGISLFNPWADSG